MVDGVAPEGQHLQLRKGALAEGTQVGDMVVAEVQFLELGDVQLCHHFDIHDLVVA